MENIIKKKKGFTLVELLSVITILLLIALICIPAVLKRVKKGKEDLYSSQIDLIKSTASSYMSDQIMHPNYSSEAYGVIFGDKVGFIISLSELQQLGYADFKISNPLCENNGYFDPSDVYIRITKIGSDYEYEVYSYNENDLTKSCVGEDVVTTKVITTKTTTVTTTTKVSGTTESNIEPDDIKLPTYDVEPSGWSKSKTVTINYPDGYINEYSTNDGASWNRYVGPVKFNENGKIIARIRKDNKIFTSDSKTVDMIDNRAPQINSFSGYSKSENNYGTTSLSLSVSATDQESGIVKYIFYKVDKSSNKETKLEETTSNTINFSNLGSNNYVVYVIDKVGNVSKKELVEVCNQSESSSCYNGVRTIYTSCNTGRITKAQTSVGCSSTPSSGSGSSSGSGTPTGSCTPQGCTVHNETGSHGEPMTCYENASGTIKSCSNSNLYPNAGSTAQSNCDSINAQCG